MLGSAGEWLAVVAVVVVVVVVVAVVVAEEGGSGCVGFRVQGFELRVVSKSKG